MNWELSPHFPYEYEVGFTTFFGKRFVVSPAVLIPRLETESLVRKAREILQQENFLKIYDIGSGSGIIGTSLADLTDEVIFVDISPDALAVAENNFRAHFPWKNWKFVISDLLKNIDFDTTSRVFIATNLPYIKNEDWKNMSEDTVFEPKIALFGGAKTGFELYERLFKEVNEKQISGVLLAEFGFDQRQIAEQVLGQYHNWQCEFFADYAGIERFVKIVF